MNLALAFWIVFLVWIVFGAWQHGTNWRAQAPNIVLLVLLLLLGWAQFGPPLHR